MHTCVPRLLVMVVAAVLAVAPVDAAQLAFSPADFPAGALVPPDDATLKTELAVDKAYQALTAASADCYADAVELLAFGKPADQALSGCLTAASTKFDAAVSKVGPLLPPCLTQAQLALHKAHLTTSLAASNDAIFCAGTVDPTTGLRVPAAAAVDDFRRTAELVRKLHQAREKARASHLQKLTQALRKPDPDGAKRTKARAGWLQKNAKALATFAAKTAKLAAKDQLPSCFAPVVPEVASLLDARAVDTFGAATVGVTDVYVLANGDDGRPVAEVVGIELANGDVRQLDVTFLDPPLDPSPYFRIVLDANGGNATLEIRNAAGQLMKPNAPVQTILANADMIGLAAGVEAVVVRDAPTSELVTAIGAFVARRYAYLRAVAILGSLDSVLVYDHLNVPPVTDPPAPTDQWDDQCYKKDFECSSIAPDTIDVGWIRLFPPSSGTAHISFLDCCLRHDVDFYCGGTYGDFLTANGRLIDCIQDAISGSNLPPIQRGIQLAVWTVLFSGVYVPYTSDDAETGMGFCSSDGSDWNSPEESETCLRRQQSCLCEGNEPAPLCDEPCRINDCSNPPPARYQQSSWEQDCTEDFGCIWHCVGGGVWQAQQCNGRGDGQYVTCQPASCIPPGPQPPAAQCP